MRGRRLGVVAEVAHLYAAAEEEEEEEIASHAYKQLCFLCFLDFQIFHLGAGV